MQDTITAANLKDVKSEATYIARMYHFMVCP